MKKSEHSLPAPTRLVVYVRMDRLGDLVLNLPSDQIPDRQVHWIITKGLRFVPESAQPLRTFNEFEKNFSVRRLFQMVSLLKSLKPEAVVVFHAPWWVSLATWLSGIPVRGGRLSQWHSFLFFNKGLRQKRSLAEIHESDYNWKLAAFALDLDNQLRVPKSLVIQPNSPEKTQAKFSLSPENYYVVHPGMGGSALNWSAEKYIELINELANTGSVALTGTEGDRYMLDPIKEGLGKKHPSIHFLDTRLSGPELLDILSGARAVVAPSTGVVHLAASLARPTIGIYSPIRVHHPRRWGPKGPFVKTLLPTGNSFEPSTTNEDQIMESLSVRDVLISLKELETKKTESLNER